MDQTRCSMCPRALIVGVGGKGIGQRKVANNGKQSYTSKKKIVGRGSGKYSHTNTHTHNIHKIVDKSWKGVARRVNDSVDLCRFESVVVLDSERSPWSRSPWLSMPMMLNTRASVYESVWQATTEALSAYCLHHTQFPVKMRSTSKCVCSPPNTFTLTPFQCIELACLLACARVLFSTPRTDCGITVESDKAH